MLRLAISNIAWQPAEDSRVADMMRGMNVSGVEIAPTRVWASPLTEGEAGIRECRRFWESRGIQIVAMQALLFGREDLTIFESAEKRKPTFDHLVGMIKLGEKLGASVLVFGSPKNRRVGDLGQQAIEQAAVPFFHDLGEVAFENGVTFCVEPNPTAYACDFITTSVEGIDLVRKVNSPGFGLHLDAGGMTLSREPIELAIERGASLLRHFHISEPQLAQIGTAGVDHAKFSSTLARLGYKNWVSIEMRAEASGSCLESVELAIQRAADYYGCI